MKRLSASASSDLKVIRKRILCKQHNTTHECANTNSEADTKQIRAATTPVAAKCKPTVGRADDRYHRRFCSCHNLFPPIPGNNFPFRLAKMPLGLFALAIIMQPTRFYEQKKKAGAYQSSTNGNIYNGITEENRSLVFVVKETGNFGQCCNIHS